MLQESISKGIIAKKIEDEEKLIEHTARIKAKIESGSAIDKSIIDREAIKELNHKEAHSKAKVAKAIEHNLVPLSELYRLKGLRFSTIVVDLTNIVFEDMYTIIGEKLEDTAHLYVVCDPVTLAYFYDQFIPEGLTYIYAHTFKYSAKSRTPKIGYKEHLELVIYLNKGNKPVNHLLPNVIESTYAKDSRNLGFYTNLLLRSANAGDTILGINITNGNLIKAAQAMLCSTVIIPADNGAKFECEKTIKELQFK